MTDSEVRSPAESRITKNSKAAIPSGEFLVYYFKGGQDSVRCDPLGNELDGHNEAGRFFQSLADAQAYASDKAKEQGDVGAGIYDHRWKIVAQFTAEETLRAEAKRRQPGRLLLWSTALLVAGALFLWWEVRSGWTAMFGFLIGSRLLLSGTLKFAQAFQASRSRRKAAVEQPGESKLAGKA
jgi:hypothetical protein